MQTFTLLAPTAMSSALTGSSTQYRPIMDSVGVAVIEMKQSSTINPPTGSCTIEIQGSLDGSDWVVLFSTSSAALTKPLGVTPDFGSGIGGYRTLAQVVQTMPVMRVCTSAALTNGANALVSVILANG
jgi:hypothetical protein